MDRKKLLMLSGILDIIVSSLEILAGIVLIIITIYLDKFNLSMFSVESVEYSLFKFLFVFISVIVFLLATVYMIFGINTLKYANLDKDAFANNTKIIFSFAITETVIAALSFLGLLSSFNLSSFIMFMVLVIICYTKYAALNHFKENELDE
jgi:hypothetical protein